MDYLPSEKFIKTVGAAVAVVLGGWLVLYSVERFGLPAPQEVSQKETESVRAYDTVSRDGDNDGLKDWEEVIWGTDPKTPDTDGDGTIDGQEVQEGRDPLKAGPNDLVIPKGQTATAGAPAPKTATESFAQDFNVRYFTVKGLNDGLPLDVDQKQWLTVAASQDIQNKVGDFKDIYTQNNITVAINKKPRAYINEVGAILSENFGGLSVSEPEILQNAASGNTAQQISKLNAYITAYSKVVAFLAGQSVPPDYADMHLELLNIENNFKAAVQEMKYLETDPMRSVIGLLLYEKQDERTIVFLKDLEAQFQKDNLTFSASEKGSVFYKYFTNYIR